MDTLRERDELNRIWDSGSAPWAVERCDRVRRTAERPRDRRLPRLRAPGPGVGPRPRRPAARQRDGARRRTTPDPAFPLHLMGCPDCGLGQVGRVRPPRADLRRRVPVPLVGVAPRGSPTRARTSQTMRERARPGRRRPRHRGRRATTATCSRRSRRSASGCLGVEPAGERRRDRPREGRADGLGVLRPRHGPRLVGRARPSAPGRRQQRDGPRARPRGLRRRASPRCATTAR